MPRHAPLLHTLKTQLLLLLADTKTCLQWLKSIPARLRHPLATLNTLKSNLPTYLQTLQKPVTPHMAESTLPWRLVRYYLMARVIALCLGVYMEAKARDAMQLMDITQLQSDFWQNLLLMHAQPPLYNIMVWVTLHLAPERFIAVPAWFMFTALAVAGLVMLYRSQLMLGVPANLAATLAFLFSISSSSLYYSNYFIYSYPATIALLGAFYFLLKFQQSGFLRHGILLFLCLTTASLFHSLFHWVFFAVAYVGLVAFNSGLRFKTLVAGIPAATLLFAWYMKNFILYGTFMASSWGGWTISNIMVYYPLSPTEKTEMIANGTLSPLALTKPFEGLETYPPAYWQHPATGYPLLDDLRTSTGTPNLHNLGTIYLSEQAGKDAVAALKAKPWNYLKAVQSSAYVYMLSPSEWFFTRSKKLTFYYDYIWSVITTGRVAWSAPSQSMLLRQSFIRTGTMPHTLLHYITFNGWYNFPWLTPIILLTLIGYGLWQAVARSLHHQPHALALWSALYVIGYVTSTSILLDFGENQRYRYYISAYFTILLGLFCTNVVIPYLTKKLSK